MKKVKPGDPMGIPAETFNTFVDVARDFQARQQTIGRQPQRQTRPTGIALVRNDSGEGRDRFDILGIDGPLITPTDNPLEFENRIAISGVKPNVEGSHAGRFVVLLEPLAENAIGRAIVTGVCVARVEITDESHGYAAAKPDESGQLISGATGAAQLLWVQPAEDRDGVCAWAIVRVGAPGGGASTILLARLVGMHWTEDTPGNWMADAFYGFFIDAIAQPNPDPMPEAMTLFWPRSYPEITLSYDLNKVLPGIPFGPTAPGEPDQENGQADVWVHWWRDYRVSEEDGGGRWWILDPLISACVN